MSTILPVSAQIDTPAGWLELQDAAGGYELHKETRAKQAVTRRKKLIESAWVAGSYATRSVDENVNEELAIYVADPSEYGLLLKVQALTSGLDQLNFQMRFTNGDLRETWQCQIADYVIETPQEMLFAHMALVRVTVPRLPTVTYEQVA